ncbi:hypothetical protein [Sorangium sp. So ce341]|uniref:hypothetical protein n=1 Tax=Sorangium sp. So ce341 TaxID=3133302 RepID=UPI003F63816A
MTYCWRSLHRRGPITRRTGGLTEKSEQTVEQSMDQPTATNVLDFKASPAAADELSASSGERRSRSNWHNQWWDDVYIGASRTPKREISAASGVSFAELLRRVNTTA